MSWQRIGIGLAALGLALGVAGCNIVGAAVLMLHPPIMQEPEIELTKNRLVVLIEYARPSDAHPIFTQTFRDRLTEVFHDKKVNDKIVPVEEIQDLKNDHTDFAKWSLQRIARELDAEQLLYVRVERLSMSTTDGYPLLQPGVELRLKVVGRDAPVDHPRLWPEEREGRLIQRARPTREAADTLVVDSEAEKLAKDAAWLAAKPFYKFDTEEKDPWEP